MGLVSRSHCVLCAVLRFAKGLPQFAALSNAGLTWKPLAKSVSVRRQVPPAAAVAAQQQQPAPSRLAKPMQLQWLTYVHHVRPLRGDSCQSQQLHTSPARPRHQPAQKQLQTVWLPSGRQSQRRPALVRRGSKQPSAQQHSSTTSVDYALRDIHGRDYVTVKVQQPAYLTLSHTEPVPDLADVYNSHRAAGMTLLSST